jgi:hypothetical protein
MTAAVDLVSTTETYDLRALNRQANQLKRRKRWALIGAILFSVSLVLVFVAVDAKALANGAPSILQLVTLLIVLGLAGLLLSALLPGLPLTRPGMEFVRLDAAGLTLAFPYGKSIFLGWADSNLSFELYDASSAPAASLMVGTPYFLRTHGTESALSTGAYEQIYSRARAHGLKIRTTRGSRWVYPAAVAPIIHYVRSGVQSALSAGLESGPKQLGG